MRVTKIVLLAIGVLVGIVGIVVTVAVASERDSLAGDALADRVLQLRDPAMRAHAYESGTGAAPVVFIHGGGSSAVVWTPLIAELGPHRVLKTSPQ